MNFVEPPMPLIPVNLCHHAPVPRTALQRTLRTLGQKLLLVVVTALAFCLGVRDGG